jgi:hypothetical protein
MMNRTTKKYYQIGDNLMFANSQLYEKALELRRQDLRLEMEGRQMLAQLPKRLSLGRRAAVKLGVLLLKLGVRLKQLEHPQTAPGE